MTMKPTARIEMTNEIASGKLCYTVRTYWKGVDRPVTEGISTGHNMQLAVRLAAAINAGRVYANPHISTDIHGQTYVSARCVLYTRHLNKSLKEIGF